MRLAFRVTITAITPLLLILVFVIFEIRQSVAIRYEALDREEQILRSRLDDRLSDLRREMSTAATILAGSTDSGHAVLSADLDFLWSWGALFHSASIDKVMFFDIEGSVLIRSDEQFRFGDDLGYSPIFRAATEYDEVWGFYEIDGVLRLAAGKLIRLYDEIPIGVVVVSTLADADLPERLTAEERFDLSIELGGHEFTSIDGSISYRATYPIELELHETSIAPVSARIAFPPNAEVTNLANLQWTIATVATTLSVVLAIMLVALLQHYLKPYTRLVQGLLQLAGKEVDYEGLRTMFRSHFTEQGHEVTRIAGAIIELTNTVERDMRLLETLSTTDALTGLGNRRFMERSLDAEIERARRYDETFSVLLADIDHFKRVNDTRGHAEGDEVLKTVAGLIRERMRTSDVTARWGGEEFLILCPHTDRAGALSLAETLRRTVEEIVPPMVEAPDGPPGAEATTSGPTGTLSVGVATFKPDEKIELTISRADEALYRAKALGRNRVEAAD